MSINSSGQKKKKEKWPSWCPRAQGVASLNCLLCPNNSPKPKDINFIIKKKKREAITNM